MKILTYSRPVLRILRFLGYLRAAKLPANTPNPYFRMFVSLNNDAWHYLLLSDNSII
jgi:hypothetical protein